MKHTASASTSLSEMTIVDTFTRLIFGDGGDFNEAELQVIATLRAVEPDVAGDDLAAMGAYLRALGVAEMIALVARVKAMPPPAPQTRAGAGSGTMRSSRSA